MLPASVTSERGHFVLESGLHSDLWLNLEALFLRPATMEPVAAELARRLAARGVDVVCGPLVEGAFLAMLVARLLDVPFTYSERFARAGGGGMFPFGYRVPETLHEHVRGKRVAIVNDVISGGSAVGGTWEALDALGTNVVAIAAMLVIGDWTARFAAERDIAVESIETTSGTMWPAGACPLCERREPLAERIQGT